MRNFITAYTYSCKYRYNVKNSILTQPLISFKIYYLFKSKRTCRIFHRVRAEKNRYAEEIAGAPSHGQSVYKRTYFCLISHVGVKRNGTTCRTRIKVISDLSSSIRPLKQWISKAGCFQFSYLISVYEISLLL